MKSGPLFYRLLPDIITDRPIIYNLTVIMLSLLSGFVILLFSITAAVLSAYLISEKLQAGIAGMSITILFISLAFFLSLLLFAVLLIKNLRRG